MPKTEKDLLINISEKVDDVQEKIHSIDLTLLKNTIALEEHMRRTENIEKEHEFFKEEIKPALNAYKIMLFLTKAAVPIATGFGIYYKYFH